jgi:hypothetical protein
LNCFDKIALQVSLYIYISTDSVYDPSQFTLGSNVDHPYSTFQQCGIPEELGYLRKTELTEEQLKSLKKKDSYGFKKLLAESLLLEQATEK